MITLRKIVFNKLPLVVTKLRKLILTIGFKHRIFELYSHSVQTMETLDRRTTRSAHNLKR